MITALTVLNFGRSFLDSWIGRATAIAVAAWIGLTIYGHQQQSVGVRTERTRQEISDVQIARAANAAVSRANARRVLDPSTDSAGQ